MSEIQPIIDRGRMAALVVGEQAIISDAFPSREQAIVKAMCLYALEVAERRLAGPYSEPRAIAYARRGGQAHLNSAVPSTAAQVFLAQQGGLLVADPVPVSHLEAQRRKGADSHEDRASDR